MGMCYSGDIFQAKVDNLIDDFEGVKTYINDVSVLIKKSLSKHIRQLKLIFSKLRAAGLKVNAPKCSFGLKEITYLGCVITWDGIKPDKKKVKGIMDIKEPTTKT